MKYWSRDVMQQSINKSTQHNKSRN